MIGFTKSLDAIGRQDVESFMEAKIPEGETVEYKAELPAKGGSDPWYSGEDKIGIEPR